MNYQMNPNAFGGTFAVFPTAQNQAKNSKRATKPRHQDRHEMTTNKHDRKEGRSANIGFAKWRVKCFYDSLVQGSSSVFQLKFCAENPPLRKAENRLIYL
jgi:hypothetical protein